MTATIAAIDCASVSAATAIAVDVAAALPNDVQWIDSDAVFRPQITATDGLTETHCTGDVQPQSCDYITAPSQLTSPESAHTQRQRGRTQEFEGATDTPIPVSKI